MITVDDIAKEVNATLKSTKPWPTFPGRQNKAFEQFNKIAHQRFGLTLWNDLIKFNSAQVDSINAQHIKSFNRHPGLESQYDQKDWDNMISVVYAVLADKTTVTDVIQQQKTYLRFVQQIFTELAGQTVTYVGLKDTDPPPPQSFPIMALFDIFFSFANLVPAESGGGPIRFIIGFIKAIIVFSQDVANQGSSGAPSPEKVFNDFMFKSMQIERELTDRFAAGIESLGETLNTVVSDYGKLVGLAKFLNQPEVIWPQQAPTIDAGTLNAMEVACWKLFLPCRWPIIRLQENDANFELKGHGIQGDTIGQAAGQMAVYQQRYPQSFWKLTGQSIVQMGTKFWYFNVSSLADVGCPGTMGCCDPRLADGSATRLFDVLGVPREDVFEQKSGWNGFRSDTIGYSPMTPLDSLLGQQ